MKPHYVLYENNMVVRLGVFDTDTTEGVEARDKAANAYALKFGYEDWVDIKLADVIALSRSAGEALIESI
jgi:hypothetical protein